MVDGATAVIGIDDEVPELVRCLTGSDLVDEMVTTDVVG